MSADSEVLLSRFAQWASGERRIIAAVVFGSHARHFAPADKWSDVDLHVTTSDTEYFGDGTWLRNLSDASVLAYVVRPASGGVKKVTAILSDGIEMDVVLIPSLRFRAARVLVALGVHHHSSRLNMALNEMATVMRSGFRLLKGGEKWMEFYTTVVRDVPGTRLDNAEAVLLAYEFFCEHRWVLQKLERGEIVAAQRVLHRSLAEMNFRVVHELRLREGKPSFREARRVEQLLSPAELAGIAISARPDVAELRAAAEQCAANFRASVALLVGDAWSWPAPLTPAR